MTQRDSVLVLGATGHQGGAVAAELLRRGIPVRGATRDPDAPAAAWLRESGADIVHVDLDDPATVRAALAGASGLYSVQPFDPLAGDAGIEREVAQGIAVAEAAADAGVPHVVYGSVDGAERDSGIPHFESKWAVEQRLRALGVPLTVLRPTAYMDDFTERHAPAVEDGMLVVSRALAADRPLQTVATRDIGFFAAEAFSRPTAWIGETLALAGDELTGDEIAKTFTEVTGHPAVYRPQPLEQLRAFSDDLAVMFDWIGKHGYQADIEGLRASHPGLIDLRSWIRSSGWGPAA